MKNLFALIAVLGMLTIGASKLMAQDATAATPADTTVAATDETVMEEGGVTPEGMPTTPTSIDEEEIESTSMQAAIKQKIPIKGAIAQGEITCDIPKQLFFGQALIDAYLLEENIHYYGILVHHSAEISVIKLENKFFQDIKAPLKSGKIFHYELSWYINDPTKDRKKQLDEIVAALKNIRQTVSDAPRKYIDNTIDIINEYYY